MIRTTVTLCSPGHLVPTNAFNGPGETDPRRTIFTDATIKHFGYALGFDEDIGLIIDLQSLSAPPRVPALIDNTCVGQWVSITIGQSIIAAKLEIIDAPSATEGLRMFDCARLARALTDKPNPLRTELSVKTSNLSRVTAPCRLNGRRITPGKTPLFVVRDGVIDSASIISPYAQAGRRVSAT